jgi:hypothetical protein
MSRSLAALVIGNSKYKKAGKLKNPANDAADMAVALTACGFSVTTVIDGTHRQMDKALADFKAALKDHDVGLFFFAGHGVQIAGENYLAAVDMQIIDETDAKHSSLALNKVIDMLETSDTKTDIIILDACRNNPWARAWRGGEERGLAPVYAPRGTLIAYATSPGQLASDGKGRNGAYTSALLEHIATLDLTIEAMFKRVRNTLSAVTSQKQISWEHTSLAGEFYFNLSVAARIKDYGPSAVADDLFELDTTKRSHKIIAALKTLTWPRQNPAIDEITPTLIAKVAPDILFVLGRNIYQAATGNANSAIAYIKGFNARMAGTDKDDRKAVLDGMLFEIFFDKTGTIRDEPKFRCFNEVFDLQRFDAFKSSFDFIAACLLPYAGRYYAIPGKGHEVIADVRLGGKDQETVLEVFVGGQQILRPSSDDQSAWDDDDAEIYYRQRSKAQFEAWLEEELIVPARLLKVRYSGAVASGKALRIPMSWTCRLPTRSS